MFVQILRVSVGFGAGASDILLGGAPSVVVIIEVMYTVFR